MNRRILGCFFLSVTGVAAAQAPETLEHVLQEAHAANARLPLPAFELAIAREKRSEARAERWLKVAVEGDFIYAPPSGYDPALTNLGEFRLQVIGRQPLYDGGARRAGVARAEADVEAAGARYRIAEKELDLEVRSRFGEFLQAETELAARGEGIERLKSYRTSLKSRQASGQGISADLLKTDVRVASEEASVVEAERRLEEARFALNDLMGRDPAAPLTLAPLTAPEPPSSSADTPWERAPDVAEAAAQTRAADAELAVARAEQKPHLLFTADVGFLGSDTSHLVPADLKSTDSRASFLDRVKRDTGYSFTLSLSWPLWDFGAIRARIAQAEQKLQQARQNLTVQRREARRQWELAESTRRNLYRQIEILSRAVPAARDSYLESESRYRGGAATALEVLEAYAASVDASVRLSQAISRYRVAQALSARWSEP